MQELKNPKVQEFKRPVISAVRTLAWPCFRVLSRVPNASEVVEVLDHAALTR
jgi:hypothetical protein